MIVEHTTESGSVYLVKEVDGETFVARLGKDYGGVRIGAEWRKAKKVHQDFEGSLVIVWPDGTPLLEGSPADSVPTTITSRVVGTHYRVE